MQRTDCAVPRPQVEKVDNRLARLAGDQWGVVTLDELRTCGFSKDEVTTRVHTGHLHRLHRGVYAVGHPNPPLEGRFLAAVKACGPTAALSHFSAAAHYGLVDWDGRHPEVTVTGTTQPRHAGIRVHRTQAADVRRHRGLPVTSPARTLVDLASTFTDRALKRVVREALGHRLTDVPTLVAALAGLAPRAGSGRLAALLAAGVPTRSELEDVVLALILDGGFEPPDVNVPLTVAGRRVVPDFRWPAHRLVVEADGAAWHDNPVARADDAERQALLEAAGERVVRITWAQAVRQRPQTLDRLRAAGVPDGCRLDLSPR
jgi:Transcriptional regulator, AbiEi antitoxin/Protein of unknown function (DUF559)